MMDNLKNIVKSLYRSSFGQHNFTVLLTQQQQQIVTVVIIGLKNNNTNNTDDYDGDYK